MARARGEKKEAGAKPGARAKARSAGEVLTIAGREVTISNPQKVLFPGPKHTKLDLVQYYLAVSAGALRGAGGRPNVLVGHPNGAGGAVLDPKRSPGTGTDWAAW